MKLIEAKESIRPLWEDFNTKSIFGSFLQSYDWGEFQKTQKANVYRYAFEESSLRGGFAARARIVGIAQVIQQPLPFNKSYFYIPHGPILDERIDKQEAWELLISRLKDIAKEQKAIFLFAEPKQNYDDIPLIKPSSKHIQTETTLILDIQRNKIDILSQMKGKARYNIGLAKRKGVQVYISQNLDDISIFLDLASKTSERDEFRLHPGQYYKDMLKTLSQNDMIELLLARCQKKWIAAIIVVYYGQMATYLHGASDYNYRYLMAPYLLQWSAIRRAKKRGLSLYDFWGVTTSADPNHRWAGFTRFKLGFSPNTAITGYPGPYEYVFSHMYSFAYKAGQKFLGRR